MALRPHPIAAALFLAGILLAGPAAAFELAFVAASPQIYGKPHDLVLAPDGRLVLTLGSGRGEVGPGVFDRPEGVAIRGADVWFSDTYNDRIVRYRIVE